MRIQLIYALNVFICVLLSSRNAGEPTGEKYERIRELGQNGPDGGVGYDLHDGMPGKPARRLEQRNRGD